MTLSPKLGAVAAGGVVLALLAGYFLWRPGQPPPIPNIPEKTISDLEAANEKAAQERERLKKEAQGAVRKAEQAQNEAARVRGRVRKLEAQMMAIRAKKGAAIGTPDDAIKELKAMGWLR